MDLAILEEATAKFLAAKSFHFTPTVGGVNNVVLYVEADSGEKFLLRVYNNGNDPRKVRFEHAVLQQLAAMELSFKIPVPLPSLEAGLPHALLSNGAEASLFEIIPGKLPKLTMAKEIGRASGELSLALARVKVDFPSPNPPYYDIYKVHHAVTRENFLSAVASSDFDHVRDAITELVKELQDIEQLAAKLLDLQLPQQLIHGDLHYDNVLVTNDPDALTGILDFEFCAMDWRAMELAICLSKYAGEQDFTYFEDFISGYMQHAELTPLEISVLPDLIALRILSNVVYFVGRAIAKEDSIVTLTSRAENYRQRIRWLRTNGERIKTALQFCVDGK